MIVFTKKGYLLIDDVDQGISFCWDYSNNFMVKLVRNDTNTFFFSKDGGFSPLESRNYVLRFSEVFLQLLLLRQELAGNCYIHIQKKWSRG